MTTPLKIKLLKDAVYTIKEHAAICTKGQVLSTKGIDAAQLKYALENGYAESADPVIDKTPEEIATEQAAADLKAKEESEAAEKVAAEQAAKDAMFAELEPLLAELAVLNPDYERTGFETPDDVRALIEAVKTPAPEENPADPAVDPLSGAPAKKTKK